jgi:phage gp29-like protein
MSTIIDQYGLPLDKAVLREPQTASIRALENQYLQPMLDGLSPARLAATLRAADNGDLIGQHRLFSDMEERDPHLCAEMGKRKLALLNLDWDIVPPRNATAAEKSSAEWVKDVITDGVDDFEDLILGCMDGVGHGFSAIELEWRQDGKEWLPAFFPRRRNGSSCARIAAH